ncbi:hypothetical protein [Streptosporangium vulgare]|uniref:Permease n=1 Tax=Streptosporangium vulgare TaxID=46190 RepID=A0ABV5TRP0_9ACTN
MEGITHRYGRFAGTIHPSGLSTPSERLAYVRPTGTGHQGWLKITKIGSAESTPMGDSLNRVPVGQLLGTIGLTLGGAAIVLLVIAARCGSTARDRRIQLLTTLGGGRGHQATVNLGEALVPVVIGTVLGALPYTVMSVENVRIPMIDQVVDSTDLRAWAWALPLVAFAACVLALSTVVGLHRATGDGRSTRPRTFADTIPRWRLYAGLLGLVAIISTPYLSKAASFLAYIGGTALLWGMLPSAAGVVIRRWGQSAASFGTRTGRGDALVAGRWTHARPGVVVRLVAVIVIGLGVITQAQVWSSRLGESSQNAQVMKEQLHDSVLVVTPRSMAPGTVNAFRHSLPRTANLFLVTSAKGPADAAVLHGSCAAIRSLGITCPAPSFRIADGDVRAVVLGQFVGHSGSTELREGNVPGATRTADSLAVVSPVESANMAAQVKETAHRAFGMAEVRRPYDSWLLGADRLAAMANWVKLLTVLMLAVLSLAVAFSSAAEFLVFTTAVAPLAILSERRRFLLGVALWNLTLPTMIAVVFGVCVAAWQGTFFVAMTEAGVFSWNLLAASAAGAGTLAVAVGIVSGAGAVRAGARWRPAAD